MSDGAHGDQPEDHEHVYCPHCNSHSAHVDREKLARTGDAFYDAHPRKGSTVDCRGRGKPVSPEHRRARIRSRSRAGANA